jgi:hypothetical protein
MAYHVPILKAIGALNKAGAPALAKWISKECPHLKFKKHLFKKALEKAVSRGQVVRTGMSYIIPVPTATQTFPPTAPLPPDPKLRRCQYKIEYAASGRSYCRASVTRIEQGELRLMPPMYKTGVDGEERAEFYKAGALFQMFRDHPDVFWLSHESQIAGFELLKPKDIALMRDLMRNLVAERVVVGGQPPSSPYTGQCWERRVLLALVANDATLFTAALSEEGATVALKVTHPRLGDFEAKYLATDVPIHYNGGGPTDHVWSYNSECVGLFYTADGEMVWGASMYQGDKHMAFGEEMLVGYRIAGWPPLKYKEGDTIVDIARKNDRAALVAGM